MPAKEVEKAEGQGLIEYFKLTTKISTNNMICFDFENKIKKYSSAEEIVEEFYPLRLAYYQKRKVLNNLLSSRIISQAADGTLKTGLFSKRASITV